MRIAAKLMAAMATTPIATTAILPGATTLKPSVFMTNAPEGPSNSFRRSSQAVERIFCT
jgi:hypothetical protein